MGLEDDVPLQVETCFSRQTWLVIYSEVFKSLLCSTNLSATHFASFESYDDDCQEYMEKKYQAGVWIVLAGLGMPFPLSRIGLVSGAFDWVLLSLADDFFYQTMEFISPVRLSVWRDVNQWIHDRDLMLNLWECGLGGLAFKKYLSNNKFIFLIEFPEGGDIVHLCSYICIRG